MQNQYLLQSPPLYSSSISNPSLDLDPPFTESELTAAEQLIQLSESTGGATSACSTGSDSSTTRSINTPAALPEVSLDDVAEDDEGLWRRNKRYRLISDVYASAAQEAGGKKNKEILKRKG